MSTISTTETNWLAKISTWIRNINAKSTTCPECGTAATPNQFCSEACSEANVSKMAW